MLKRFDGIGHVPIIRANPWNRIRVSPDAPAPPAPS
jgi:hypothetical protein